MSRWFRSYADTHRNPKVARLSDADFRLWHQLLCVAAENDGLIPPEEDLKNVLNRRLDHLSAALKRLVNGALIDPLEAGYCPRNWGERQYKSDTSTERVRKHRGKRNATGNVSVTPPETDTETEEEASASSIVCAEKAKAVSRVLRSTYSADGFHALPAGWVPSRPFSPNTQSMVDGWPPGAFAAELESFRAWAANAKPEKGKGLKKDWDDAFANWIRREHRDRYSKVVSLRRDRPGNPLTALYRSTMQPENPADGNGARISLPPAGNG